MHRRPVNKRSSHRSFNQRAGKTHSVNKRTGLRGGIRL